MAVEIVFSIETVCHNITSRLQIFNIESGIENYYISLTTDISYHILPLRGIGKVTVSFLKVL